MTYGSIHFLAKKINNIEVNKYSLGGIGQLGCVPLCAVFVFLSGYYRNSPKKFYCIKK